MSPYFPTPVPPFLRAVLSFLVRVPGPSAVAWPLFVSAWGRVYGCVEALTPPQHIQALLSGDTHTDTTSFYDRVWAAIRDKYRSEVCGERRGSGPAPAPTPTKIPRPGLTPSPLWRPPHPDV